MTTLCNSLRSKAHTITGIVVLSLLALASTTLFAQTETDEMEQTTQAATVYKFTTVNVTGAGNTYAYAINNQEEIVGYYTGAGCSQAACGFKEVNGKFATIDCALENATDIFDISNKGKIVGAYSYYGGVHGFIWEGDSSCFDIVAPEGPSFTEALGVNDDGQVVGFYIDAAGNFQGFSHLSGKYTTISCPGWTSTRAYGINDAGVIVGDVSNSTSGPFTAFVYKAGKCSTFNFAKGDPTSAKGINKSGQITGWYTNSKGTHGFVKTDNSLHTLNYPKATGTLAFHINDKGQVAGWYEVTSGAVSGFVATP